MLLPILGMTQHIVGGFSGSAFLWENDDKAGYDFRPGYIIGLNHQINTKEVITRQELGILRVWFADTTGISETHGFMTSYWGAEVIKDVYFLGGIRGTKQLDKSDSAFLGVSFKVFSSHKMGQHINLNTSFDLWASSRFWGGHLAVGIAYSFNGKKPQKKVPPG